MDRREALQKAVLDTAAVGSGAMLPLEVARRFIVTLKEMTALGTKMTLDTPTAPSGQLNKFSTSSRIVRSATENSDDGYRAGASFPTVAYATKKLRLPWEVTEDVFHENIAGESLEETIAGDMTKQFALDIEDIEVNGDEAGAAPFVNINDGILKQLVTAGGSTHRVDGSTINSGTLSKSHFFSGAKAMPNKYYKQGGLVWLMSPKRHIHWIEILTDRATGAGDNALISQGPPADAPLGVPILEVPSFPDTRIVLCNPANFHKVISWQIRKRRITGETDMELAAVDKRFYVYFLKHDVIIEELDAIVDIHTLSAIP